MSRGASPPAPARQRIVDGARRHFFAHGFRGVTMDDLAEELGMSKKTLYAHFPGKGDLLRAVIHDKFTGMDADLERVMAGRGGRGGRARDFPATLHALLAGLQQQAEEIQPAFLRDIRRESPEVFKLVEARRREVIQRWFGRLFNEGRKAGLVRADLPSWLMIEVLLGAVQAILNPARLEELGLTPKTGSAAILSVVLEGVLTRRGKGSAPAAKGRNRP
jgi:AcrR family transcriptional regulator